MHRFVFLNALVRLPGGVKISAVLLLSILLGCGGGGSLPAGGGGGGNGGGAGGSGRSAPCGVGQPTWTQLANQPFANPGAEGVVGLAVDKSSNTLWAGAQGAAAKSTDGGQTWTVISTGLPADKVVLRIGFNRLNEPLAVLQHGGAEIYRLVNGSQWVQAQTPYSRLPQGYSNFVVDGQGNVDVVVAAAGNPLTGDFIRSTDDGSSFQMVAANIASIYGGQDLTTLTEDKSNGYLYTGGSGETTVGVLRSTDGGVTWTLAGSEATIGPAPLTSLAFNKSNQLLMSFGKHTIYPVYRLNPDLSTTPASTLPQYNSGSQMFAAPDGQLFLPVNGSSYSDAGFYCSSGDGLTWSRYHDAQLQGTAIEGVIDNNGYIFALIFDSSMRSHLYKSSLPVF